MLYIANLNSSKVPISYLYLISKEIYVWITADIHGKYSLSISILEGYIY